MGCAEAAAVSSRPRTPRRIPEFRFVMVTPPRVILAGDLAVPQKPPALVIDSALVQEDETGGLLPRRQSDREALRDVGRSGERLGKAGRNDFRQRVGAGREIAELESSIRGRDRCL